MGKYLYHYSHKDAKKAILEHGLLSPARLVEDGVETDLIDTYQDRIKDVYDGKIDESVVLDYLDFQFGDVLQILHAGRNVFYCSFAPVPEGLSEGHDEILSGVCWQVDVQALKKDLGEDCQFAIIEIPTDDPKVPTEIAADLATITNLAGVDLLTPNWDEEGSDGFLFGNIPHVAIWVYGGNIPAKYLKEIDE